MTTGRCISICSLDSRQCASQPLYPHYVPAVFASFLFVILVAAVVGTVRGLFGFGYLEDYGAAVGIVAGVWAVDVGFGLIVLAIQAPFGRF